MIINVINELNKVKLEYKSEITCEEINNVELTLPIKDHFKWLNKELSDLWFGTLNKKKNFNINSKGNDY